MSLSLSYAAVRKESVSSSMARFIGESVASHPPYFHIDVVAQPILRGVADASTFMLEEEEVNGELEGDFVHQFGPNTGHNPKSGSLSIGDVYDRIGFALDTRKPCSTGRATWNIPVILKDSHDPLHQRTIHVVQEYLLQDRRLTVSKGGSLLLDCAVPLPSPPREDIARVPDA